jgi:hypothetical protein
VRVPPGELGTVHGGPVTAGSADRRRQRAGGAAYDLGGGTFDAAVLRKTQAGFKIIGRPGGIERLGGRRSGARVSMI